MNYKIKYFDTFLGRIIIVVKFNRIFKVNVHFMLLLGIIYQNFNMQNNKKKDSYKSTNNLYSIRGLEQQLILGYSELRLSLQFPHPTEAPGQYTNVLFPTHLHSNVPVRATADDPSPWAVAPHGIPERSSCLQFAPILLLSFGE